MNREILLTMSEGDLEVIREAIDRFNDAELVWESYDRRSIHDAG